LHCAQDWGAELIVLGIHRHAGLEMFRGTTADRVARFGHAPVLVVKDPVLGPYRRIVVPVDLSVHSRRALSFSCKLAPRGQLHLVYAIHSPFKGLLGPQGVKQIVREERESFGAMLQQDITDLVARLGPDAPRFDTVMEEGDARRVIREQVVRLKPDLLAIGTHGRTGIARTLLGSVAEDLLADAPVDVLAVKAW
jgi:nucleotide-binding universal stress UspA family protein